MDFTLQFVGLLLTPGRLVGSTAHAALLPTVSHRERNLPDHLQRYRHVMEKHGHIYHINPADTASVTLSCYVTAWPWQRTHILLRGTLDRRSIDNDAINVSSYSNDW